MVVEISSHQPKDFRRQFHLRDHAIEGSAPFLLAPLDYRTQEALLVTKKLLERGERSAGLTNTGSETDSVEALVKKKRFRRVTHGFTAILSAGRSWLVHVRQSTSMNHRHKRSTW